MSLNALPVACENVAYAFATHDQMQEFVEFICVAVLLLVSVFGSVEGLCTVSLHRQCTGELKFKLCFAR
jgi:hypothetical protein